MNKPLLSICIPTYNRAEYLKKSIESIVCQPEFNSDKVEIVISDNCSTDTTEELCRNYEKQYSNIHYFRNEVNIRDKNFPTVLAEASGIFKKLSNDTVLYNKGSIRYLLKLLKRADENTQLFFLSKKFHFCNKKLNGIENFLYTVSFYITSITCIGFWGKDCSDIRNKTYGCDKNLWQVPFLLNLVLNKKKSLIVRKKLWKMIPVKKKDVSYGLYHVFYENFLFLIGEYCQNGNVSKKCYDWIEKDLLFNYFSYWLLRYKKEKSNYLVNKKEDFFDCVHKAYLNKPYYHFLKFKILYCDIRTKIANLKNFF